MITTAAGDGARRGALRYLGTGATSVLAVAVVLTALFAILQGTPLRATPDLLLRMLLITACFVAALNTLYHVAWRRLSPRIRSVPGQAALHVALIGVGSVIGAELAARSLGLLGHANVDELRRQILPVGLVVSTVVVAVTLLHERQQQRVREAELRAELEALKARVHPHFLFNSLNTAAGLAAQDPEKAERMLERLSGLYRHVLQRSDATWIRLEEEVEAVKDYLEIESLRLGDRLRAEIDCAPEALQALVPPMILQPLVENAVLHGVAPRREGGSVRVVARRDARGLELVVEDDGPGPGASEHRGTGTSLEDLRKRLRALHGEGASVEMGASSASGGCRVRVRIPAGTPEAP